MTAASLHVCEEPDRDFSKEVVTTWAPLFRCVDVPEGAFESVCDFLHPAAAAGVIFNFSLTVSCFHLISVEFSLSSVCVCVCVCVQLVLFLTV